MQRLVSTAALLCTLAAPALAQSYYMPSNTPNTGTCNSFPFGQKSFIYQTLASQTDLGGKAVANISEIAFAPCSGKGVLHFDTIEIVMAQTATAPLGTTFASNLQFNKQVVLSAKNYDWHLDSNVWNRIGLEKDYLYIAGTHPNLVIQIIGTGVTRTGISTSFHRDSTHQRVYALNWVGTPPATGASSMAALKFEVSVGMGDLNTFGAGCKGSNGVPALEMAGSPKLGGSIGFTVKNCPNNTAVLHNFGATHFPMGIDLGLIGAPGCSLYETTDIILGGASDASGNYNLKVAIPNLRGLMGLRLYNQAFPRDAAANKWGFSSSNYGRILIGN